MELTDQDIMDISSLIYHKWTEAFETLKRVKSETDDGSLDWDDFHQIRLENATKTEAYWNSFKNRYIEINRTALNRGFGI